MWFFSTDEKYEAEKSLAVITINKIEKELGGDMPQHIREKKEMILKCIKYYYGL